MTKIKQFGNWVIDDEGITFIGKKDFDSTYKVYKDRLWELRPDGESNKWDWPLHLTSKKWIDKEELDNFVLALKYAQEYFIEIKPEGLGNINWEETIKEAYNHLRFVGRL